MENEGKMLNYIFKKEDVSQRKIAKYMGLSLGQTNFILHNLVKKGLLKIEKITPRNIKYILTPQGIAKTTKRTYNYIINAIAHVLSLETELISIVKNYTAKGYTVYLDGEKDEIYNILQLTISDNKLTQIKWLDNEDKLVETNQKALVILWNNEKAETYKKLGVDHLNLLDRIDDL